MQNNRNLKRNMKLLSSRRVESPTSELTVHHASHRTIVYPRQNISNLETASFSAASPRTSSYQPYKWLTYLFRAGKQTFTTAYLRISGNVYFRRKMLTVSGFYADRQNKQAGRWADRQIERQTHTQRRVGTISRNQQNSK